MENMSVILSIPGYLRVTEKVQVMCRMKEKMVNTTKDPQEVIAETMQELGYDKSRMATFVSKENMKRCLRKMRQTSLNPPVEPDVR